MRELKSMVELMQIVKCYLCIVCTLPSARRFISHAHKRMRVLRTKDGAHVSIILATKVIVVISLVASLGKYVFRIQNPYLFIDCSIENGIVVVYWRGGEW